MSTQTERMIDVATTAIKAAETEESIGSTGESEASSDYELQVGPVAITSFMIIVLKICLFNYSFLQKQVRHVKVTMSEINKLAPQLLNAAEMAASQPGGSATMEHLNLLSQEWATKVRHGVRIIILLCVKLTHFH